MTDKLGPQYFDYIGVMQDKVVDSEIRVFETGATRNTEADKLDYEGFLSPIVLERYAEYMHKHRHQKDGNLRASDNWQNHFGENHFSVCMKSLWRHFMDLWMEHRGFASREGIEDALMGIMFNAMAYADKYLKDKKKKVNQSNTIQIGDATTAG